MNSHNKSIRKQNLRSKLKWANIFNVLVILGLMLVPTTKDSIARGTANSLSASPFTWTTEVVDGPPFLYMMTDRSLRYEKSGLRRPCVAYGGDHLYYSCWNSASNTWTTVTVDDAPMVGSYAALAFNSFNIPFISYYDALNAQLKLAYKLPMAIAWTTRPIDNGNFNPPLAPVVPLDFIEPESLTAEQAEEAATSYWDQLWAIFPHLNIFAPGFLFGKIGVGKHTSIDIGTDNIVHVSYYDEINGALKHFYWNLNDPPPPLPVDPPNPPDPNIYHYIEYVDFRHDGDLGLWTSIAVDELNRPQISYMDEKYDDLRYAVKNGTTWDIRVVDTGVNVGPFSSIAIDPSGMPNMYPRIIYMSFNYGTNNYALRYANLQTNNTTWTKGIIDNSPGVGLFASLTISNDGVYRASYYDGVAGNLLYVTSSNGTSWTGRAVVASAGNQGLFTSIAFDPNNDPAITYVDASNGIYKMSYKPSNTWLSAATIGTTGNVGMNSSLAINSSGVPHISYLNETRGQLKYAHTTAAIWSTEVITHTAYLGTSNSIGVAYESIPKVAYYDETKGELRLSTRSGTWLEQKVDTYRDVGAFVSMAIDTQNIPHMSYVDQTQDRLMYAKWDINASDWITETRVYEGVGGYTSIALDGTGLFGQVLWGISYYDFANENLKLTYMGQGGTPQTTQLFSLGDPNDNIQILEPYSSVDFDSGGRAHIAFYDENMGKLRYAIFQHSGPDPNPALSIVDGLPDPNFDLDAVDVGRFVSLVIDRTNDQRHLCYYDAIYGDLKYAFWDGTWDIKVIDSVGDVGMYCSIELTAVIDPYPPDPPRKYPGISYYDASNADLKYARTYPLPLAIPSIIFLPIVIQP